MRAMGNGLTQDQAEELSHTWPFTPVGQMPFLLYRLRRMSLRNSLGTFLVGVVVRA